MTTLPMNPRALIAVALSPSCSFVPLESRYASNVLLQTAPCRSERMIVPVDTISAVFGGSERLSEPT